MYLLDAIRGSEQDCSVETCKFGFYKSSDQGAIDSWERTKIFNHRMEFIANNHKKGELYIWDKDFIYISKNYGESFDLLYEIDEEITGVSVEGEQVFIATISSLYELKNDELILLREIPVSIEERDSEIPSQITLYQNYPNPFNPSTVIRFELTQTAQVSLKIYDALGSLVQTLVSEKAHPAGEYRYTWNADFHISSGVYFYRLVTGQETLTKKMILIK